MRSMTRLALPLACAGFMQSPSALAETLRCGSALIQAGDDAGYVLENCGQPSSGNLIADPMLTGGVPVYQIGSIRADRWRYHRQPGQFTAVVTIGDDGRVQSIEFERIRD